MKFWHVLHAGLACVMNIELVLHGVEAFGPSQLISQALLAPHTSDFTSTPHTFSAARLICGGGTSAIGTIAVNEVGGKETQAHLDFQVARLWSAQLDSAYGALFFAALPVLCLRLCALTRCAEAIRSVHTCALRFGSSINRCSSALRSSRVHFTIAAERREVSIRSLVAAVLSTRCVCS